MNEKTEERIKLEALLDRIDAALRRIAVAPRPKFTATDPVAAAPSSPDLAARLDHLIVDLRRALSGDSQ